MIKKIQVPICIDCKKPHYGRKKVEDRCICDTSGKWEYGIIEVDDKEIEEINKIL